MSGATLNEARLTLSPEFGFKVVNESGRSVLLVRVPRQRPDYMTDLQGAAEVVDLETLNSVKDVLLVGEEKVTRMDPLPLRDNIKARRNEDATLIAGLVKRLETPYEVTTFKHNGKVPSTRLAVRIPRPSIGAITAEDIDEIRKVSIPALEAPGGESVSVFYVIADNDFERLGRATFHDIIGLAPPAPPAVAEAPGAGVNYAVPTNVNPYGSVALPQAAPAQPAAPAWNGFPAPGPVGPVAAPPSAGPASIALPAREAPEPKEGPIVEKTTINEDTEIYVSKKPAPKPKGGKPPADTRPVRQQVEDDPDAKILSASDEYVVYTSTKKTGPDPAEANKPFLLSDLESLNRKAGKAGKDYEIMSGSTSPYLSNAVSPLKAAAAAAANKGGPAPASIVSPIMAAAAASRMQGTDPLSGSSAAAARHNAPAYAAPPAAPQVEAAVAPPVANAGAYATPAPATQYAPQPLTGAPQTGGVIQGPPVGATPWGVPAPAPVAAPAPEPVDPLVALLNAFNAGKYETIKDLNVAGNTFALAAHKNGGKRVLVKNVDAWDESQQTAAIQNAEALGADVLVVVAKEVAPGARIAAWGTKLQIVTPAEAAHLSL